MQPVQLKMARAALDLTADDLAREAGVEADAVAAFERGETVAGEVTSALNLFLSTHGIQLIEGDGVRAQAHASTRRDYVPVDELTTANDGGIS